MTTWFTSDLHFGHANIIKYCNRPWDNVEEMNQGLVDRWNYVVGARDLVYVMGDLCWGAPSTFAPWLEQLNGDKMLVPGNHDTCWDGHRKPKDRLKLKQLGFQVLDGTVVIRTPEWQALGCHFPYVSDSRHDDKFFPYFPRDNGEWLIHGHIHTSWKVKDRMVNVGCDVWDWHPITAAQIGSIIKEGS